MMKPAQPLFFKKLPQTENTPPNAEFRRYMGRLNGTQVVEIVHAGQKWLVNESEVLSVGEALSRKAQELHVKIEEQRAKTPRKSDLVRALGICYSTFRRWCGLIQNYLPGEAKK